MLYTGAHGNNSQVILILLDMTHFASICDTKIIESKGIPLFELF